MWPVIESGNPVMKSSKASTTEAGHCENLIPNFCVGPDVVDAKRQRGKGFEDLMVHYLESSQNGIRSNY